LSVKFKLIPITIESTIPLGAINEYSSGSYYRHHIMDFNSTVGYYVGGSSNYGSSNFTANTVYDFDVNM
jgi:hypothetical protein